MYKHILRRLILVGLLLISLAIASSPILAQTLPAASELDKSWSAMTDADPLVAWRAAFAMAAQGDKAVDYIRDHTNCEHLDEQKIRQAIADLDSTNFATRQKAQQRLEQALKAAEPLLKKTLQGNPSAEVKIRVETLLEHCDQWTNADGRRMARAVPMLELIGTDAAKKLSQNIADTSSWGSGQAKEWLAKLATSTTMPLAPTTVPAPPAGETMIAVCIHVFSLDPALADKALALGTPVDSGNSRYVAFSCLTEAVFSLIKPGLDKPDKPGTPNPGLVDLGSFWLLEAGANWTEITNQYTKKIDLRNDAEVNDQDQYVLRGAGLARTGISVDKGQYRLSLQGYECHLAASYPSPSLKPRRDDARRSFDVSAAPGRSLCILDNVPPFGDYHPHHWFIASFVSAPKPDVPLLHSCQDPRTWITLGPKGVLAMRHQARKWEQSAVTPAVAEDRWIRTLPSGAQVRLLAIRDGRINPFMYWTPDGRPCTAFYHPFYADTSRQAVVQWRPNAKTPWDSGPALWQWEDYLYNDNHFTRGWDDGPWKEVGTLKIKQALKVDGAEFVLRDPDVVLRKRLDPPEAGLIRLGLTYMTQPDFNYAAAVIDKNGKLIKAQRCDLQPLGSGGQTVGPNTTFRDDVKADINDIGHYVLIKRPRTWVTFEGFATKPGASTTQPASTNPAAK